MSCISNLVIIFLGDGTVTFTILNEFEITLTLMGNSPSIPWRVLKVEILVRDPSFGARRTIVHPQQVMLTYRRIKVNCICYR